MNMETKSNKRTKMPSASTATTKNKTSKLGNSEPGLLKELFIDELKDIYWAEKHLVKSLPKMHKAATTGELKKAFSDHLEVTKGHVTRLEKAFELMDKKPQAKKCEAMAGLTKEAEEIIEDTEKGSFTRDVALIMAAQKVEHYEIATYGSLAQLAKTIGNSQVSKLMSDTLSEERQADELLTFIAEKNINVDATSE